jgi:hypothetical protein
MILPSSYITEEDILALIDRRIHAAFAEREARAAVEHAETMAGIFQSSDKPSLHVVSDNPNGVGDRSDVRKRLKNARGVLDQFRSVILGKKPSVQHHLDQSDGQRCVGVTELVGSAASKHEKPSGLRVVFCDDSSRLYRIDPENDEYVQIGSAQ